MEQEYTGQKSSERDGSPRQEGFDRVITAEHGSGRFRLRNLRAYRDLILFYARKNVVVGYKQTVLGPFWLFLYPFCAGLVQMFIFGYLAGFQTGGVPKIVFYLFSNSAWMLFSKTFSNDSGILTHNARLFGKVYFPRLTISCANIVSTVVTTAAQFAIDFAILIVFLIRGEIALTPFAPLILLPFLQMIVLGQGLGLIYASITARYRDMRQLQPLITRILLYYSPVVFPLSKFENPLIRTICLVNPLCPSFELFRAFLWGGPYPPLWSILWSAAATILIEAAGIHIFSRTERTFIDYI